ncbi:hypothetical protein BaRGS_00003002 [Batillaria attramentaria]|uniref:Uncharacterized protein n=1 Tax=Batillaria attramentaria TaxID=370345 RepID=A0ABD0M2K2_9CAEN
MAARPPFAGSREDLDMSYSRDLDIPAARPHHASRTSLNTPFSISQQNLDKSYSRDLTVHGRNPNPTHASRTSLNTPFSTSQQNLDKSYSRDLTIHDRNPNPKHASRTSLNTPYSTSRQDLSASRDLDARARSTHHASRTSLNAPFSGSRQELDRSYEMMSGSEDFKKTSPQSRPERNGPEPPSGRRNYENGVRYTGRDNNGYVPYDPGSGKIRKSIENLNDPTETKRLKAYLNQPVDGPPPGKAMYPNMSKHPEENRNPGASEGTYTHSAAVTETKLLPVGELISPPQVQTKHLSRPPEQTYKYTSASGPTHGTAPPPEGPRTHPVRKETKCLPELPEGIQNNLADQGSVKQLPMGPVLYPNLSTENGANRIAEAHVNYPSLPVQHDTKLLPEGRSMGAALATSNGYPSTALPTAPTEEDDGAWRGNGHVTSERYQGRAHVNASLSGSGGVINLAMDDEITREADGITEERRFIASAAVVGGTVAHKQPTTSHTPARQWIKGDGDSAPNFDLWICLSVVGVICCGVVPGLIALCFFWQVHVHTLHDNACVASCRCWFETVCGYTLNYLVSTTTRH